MRHVLIICLSVASAALLAACQTAIADDPPATIAVEMTAYAREAAEMQRDIVIERTRSVATQQAAETQAANYYNYNRVLLSTVRANQRPTQAMRRVDVQPGVSAGRMDDTGAADIPEVSALGGASSASSNQRNTNNPDNMTIGEMRFSQVRMAGTIEAFERCPLDDRDLFRTTSIDIIYLTMVTDNLRTGTRISVDWLREGQNQFESVWVSDRDAARLCIAMELSQADVAFTPGNWQAVLSVNGQRYDPVPFVIVGG